MNSINFNDNRINVFIKDCKSNDGTIEYLDSLDIDNLNYVSKYDKGIYDAMNQSLSYINTDYINFLNAGEVLLPNALDRILNQLIDEPKILKFLVQTENDEIRKERAGYFYFTKHMLNHQGLVYNIRCFKLNQFKNEMKIVGDLRHLIEFNLWKEIKYIDEVIIKYQGNGIATNFDSIGINWKERLTILKWEKVDFKLKFLMFLVSFIGFVNWKIKSFKK